MVVVVEVVVVVVVVAEVIVRLLVIRVISHSFDHTCQAQGAETLGNMCAHHKRNP